MRVLVTGGVGFIGSHFIEQLMAKWPDYKVLNIDCLSYAGNLANLANVAKNSNYQFAKVNICDNLLLEGLFSSFKPDVVVHFAAESHVDNSIASPNNFIQTNIIGTFNLLELARKYWCNIGSFLHHRFIHISTDEVYGSLGRKGIFKEGDPLRPNSPYSASKGASDLLVRSYHKTYDLNAIICHCSNNFGPKQHAEKFIPTIIRNALLGNTIPIYGKGENIRDWIYVVDHCLALIKVLEEGSIGDTYNIGGNQEWDNLSLAKSICNLLDQKIPAGQPYTGLINFVEDRLGHDFRYAIDSGKIRQLGWFPRYSFDEALAQTVDWYIEQVQMPVLS